VNDAESIEGENIQRGGKIEKRSMKKEYPGKWNDSGWVESLEFFLVEERGKREGPVSNGRNNQEASEKALRLGGFARGEK